MKRFIAFLIVVLFIPTFCYASVIDEVPPYVDIIGINETDYNITKTITDDEVIIKLTEKATGLSYSWSFDKDKIDNKISLDFNIDFESTKKEEIDNISGDMDKIYLSFNHHGTLPSNAKIKVNVSSKFKDGDKLYLYYYNETTGNAEFVENNIEVIDGYAEFEINHCSEYFLTGAIVNDATNNPKNLNHIIIGLVVVVLGLMAYTMFKR